MTTLLDEAMSDFLIEGDEDYIGLWEIIPYISEYLSLNEKKMTVAEAEKFWTTLSGFIARMLTNGFIAVDITREGGYTAWPEQEPKQVMTKIRNLVVEARGNLADAGFGVWFYKLKPGDGLHRVGPRKRFS